jgi:hypothetical protein
VNPWPFIVGAYVLTLVGTMTLLGWSYFAMRRAERQAEKLSRRP